MTKNMKFFSVVQGIDIMCSYNVIIADNAVCMAF